LSSQKSDAHRAGPVGSSGGATCKNLPGVHTGVNLEQRCVRAGRATTHAFWSETGVWESFARQEKR